MTNPIDQSGRTVLVTGGTMGIGLACALAFAAQGAQIVATYRWGSADMDDLRAKFAGTGGPAPLFLEADVGQDEDTTALMEAIAARFARIDVLISNVAFAQKTENFGDYSRRSLHRSIDYSAWPLAAYTQAIKTRFGAYPRHVIGMSSPGPDDFFMNYDFVAASKSVLETFCRYMNFRLFDDGVKVNVIRSRLVRTASYDATFGDVFHRFLESVGGFEDCYTTPQEVANVVLMVAGGFCDAIGGQVITVDKGFEFFDNLMGIAERARRRGKLLWAPQD